MLGSSDMIQEKLQIFCMITSPIYFQHHKLIGMFGKKIIFHQVTTSHYLYFFAPIVDEKIRVVMN